MKQTLKQEPKARNDCNLTQLFPRTKFENIIRNKKYSDPNKLKLKMLNILLNTAKETKNIGIQSKTDIDVRLLRRELISVS